MANLKKCVVICSEKASGIVYAADAGNLNIVEIDIISYLASHTEQVSHNIASFYCILH